MEEVAAWGGNLVLLLLPQFPVGELQQLLREEKKRGKREERRKRRKNIKKFSYLKFFGRNK
jgi:hypothetical protein